MEILVCIGILGVLAALLFPGLAAMQNRAYLSKCTSNMRQIHGMWTAYSVENNGILLPSYGNGYGWDDLLQRSSAYPPGTKAESRPGTVFHCPSNPGCGSDQWRFSNYAYNQYMGFVADNPDLWLPENRSRYEYRMNSLDTPQKIPILADAGVRTWNANFPNGAKNQTYFAFAGVEKGNEDAQQDGYVAYRYHNNHANFLFADGHVETLGPTEAKQRFDSREILVNRDNAYQLPWW